MIDDLNAPLLDACKDHNIQLKSDSMRPTAGKAGRLGAVHQRAERPARNCHPLCRIFTVGPVTEVSAPLKSNHSPSWGFHPLCVVRGVL
jgi:hypothetical protein